MDVEKAKSIINYVVTETKKLWQYWEVEWAKIDEVFLLRGYEQKGFDTANFAELLKQEGIFSIEQLGLILDRYEGNTKYNRDFAGSLTSRFYQEMKNGIYGEEGRRFFNCVETFRSKHYKAGQIFWKLLWYMLVSCNYLKNKYNASFSFFLKKKYAEYKDLLSIQDSDFLSIDAERWEKFKKDIKPWEELSGISANVFDFVIRDIKEAKFARDSYKLDSSNERFFKITGILKLLNDNLARENVVNFLKGLGLQYTLREINMGIYAYCSRTESHNFGFCRGKEKCKNCGVNNICEQNFGLVRK